MPETKVLIVEDEAIASFWMRRVLAQNVFQVVGAAATGEEAVALARDKQPDIILMDVRLAGSMDGFEAAKTIHGFCACPIIFMSGNPYLPVEGGAMADVGASFLPKPFTAPELLATVRAALGHRGLSSSDSLRGRTD